MRGIEDKLKDKMYRAKKDYVEQPRKTNDIFARAGIIIPNQIVTTNYFDRTPIAAFNPGVSEVYNGSKIDVYPRLHFDGIYNQSPAVIGKFQLNIEEFLNRDGMLEQIQTKIVIYPTNPWELIGCEDPRIFEKDQERYTLYTGWGICDGEKKSVLGIQNEDKKDYFIIEDSKGNTYTPFSNKDAAILYIECDIAQMMTRLHLGDGDQFCWSCGAYTDTNRIIEESLEVQLIPNENEDRIGLSTNAVKLSQNEYLIGWHATLKKDWRYVNGLALVDSLGNLKAITDYLLVPQGIKEWVGNRYGVIFGCGLVRYKDQLIWVGGISDWAIGVFHTDFEKAMSEMRWI